MPTPAPVANTATPGKGAGMSQAEKIGIVVTLTLILGAIIYIINKNTTSAAATIPPVTAVTTTAASGTTTAATIQQSAIDQQDEAATQAMIAAVQGSQFAGSLPYIYGMLPNYMQGGPNNIGDSYGTITINGQNVTPLSSAFAGAMWNGWASSVISNINAANSGATPTPANGHSQADATAAFTLLKQIASIWENYKEAKASSILGIPL